MAAARPPLEGILIYSEEPLVSSDVIKSSYATLGSAPCANLQSLLPWHQSKNASS